ncbi:ABC transporter ATP-binding protein [Cytobacillus depressus]|uniref:ABC transporter ATP-binding protein n=1 Tax=Cytobacillus depressus TaxID=1602942 RepID=A0A6L3V2H4_9BACI|nr:ABC transporter ATP-binding protein [Cytobacillus depressus]KAB2330453.1 ABC transporter ATP-binding protein [Cytobacillus depressus]
MKTSIMQVKNLTKQFGGITAVNDVSFDVNQGEIVAVIGPNGAGKTTLFNMISSVLPPTKGEVWFMGERINGAPIHSLAGKGITRTFQNLQIFENMSVLENVMLGVHTQMKTNVYSAALRLPRVKHDDELARRYALEALEMIGIKDQMNEIAGNLPYGLQKLLEIARAIVSNPKLILLDEPMAGLNDGETSKIANILIEMKRNGLSFLFVEHDMKTVMRIADRIVVIDFGNKIAEGTPEEIQKNQKVIAAYLGEEVL